MGDDCVTVTLRRGSGQERLEVASGEVRLMELGPHETARVTIEPTRHFDAGEGPGRPVQGEVEGGIIGLVIDGRGRPLELPEDDEERFAAIQRWERELSLYPEQPEDGEGAAR
jgi:hypothetical protein